MGSRSRVLVAASRWARWRTLNVAEGDCARTCLTVRYVGSTGRDGDSPLISVVEESRRMVDSAIYHTMRR